jgi:hypothetical protein
MSFNAPIRVPINNTNNSVSDQASHFKAYVKQREEMGNPVRSYTKYGGPEGFHHADMLAPKGMGMGKPVALTHHHLARSIRDPAPKFVHDKRFNLPATPVLCHHPEPKVDYRTLPQFTPTGERAVVGGTGSSWQSSSLSFHYTGRNASSTGARYANASHGPVTLSLDRLQPMHKLQPRHSLPPAGLKLSKFTNIS